MHKILCRQRCKNGKELRNGTFYFRMRVPAVFRKQLGISEIRHVLNMYI